MSPSEPSENPWQEVGRGGQKKRAPSQSTSSGRGLQSAQPPTQMASAGRNLPKANPILQANMNRRGPPTAQHPSQARNGRVQNSQVPTRPAPTGPSLPKSQPVLSSAPNSLGAPNSQPALNVDPNGAVLQSTPAPQKTAARKKENVPYEIKNAREWDPKRRLQADSSSDSSDDDDYYDSDYEYPQVFGDTSNTRADEGFQLVANERPHSNARPHGQPPSHPKSHPQGNPRGSRRATPRVNFNYKRDNLARAAFRKRLNPTGKFPLPKDCHDIEPNQKRMYDMFDEIGVRLGSFVRPPQKVEDRELLLWGDSRQVQATVAELQRWLENRLQMVPRKSMAKDNFARELSSIGVPYNRLMRKMQKEAQILNFQQVPAETRVFPCTGTLIWPIDEVRPEDILGSSLEAFDPLRFQHQCHIVFDNKLSSFRIFSDKEEYVKRTMDRIVGTMREYVAKSARPDKITLVEPPNSSTIRKDVKILPASLNHPKAGKSMVPLLTGSALDAEARNEWLNESNELIMKNHRRMELSLRKCIANLPHYRGLVRMRVQFGTFALKVFRWKEGAASIPFPEFMENMTMSGTKGEMIRDLQIQKDATTIIAKVQKATDLFLPMDSLNLSLEEVVPSFSACFEFKSPNSPPMTFTLESSSSAAAPTIYENVQEVWTRTDRRDNAVPLEAFIARLDGGASWKLQVSTENSIDSSRIDARMTKFAESVKLSKIPRTRTELTGQRVFTWEKDLPGVMQPSAFQQKTALKYRLRNQSEWIFEIARYDSYGDPRNENLPVETNWGGSLHNTNWDSILTANSTLGIGEAARWNPNLETFFPSRPGTVDVEGLDPGVTDFFQNVEVVTKFINSIKKELPHLRN